MGRTIIIGDVHGCRLELARLLETLHFGSGDHLVFVGDLVARGPDSLGVLDIVRESGASLVLGNHERKLLSRRADPTVQLGKMHLALYESLRDADWKLLVGAPYTLDLPEHGLRIVHAGILPNLSWDAQQPLTLVNVRAVNPKGEIGQRGVHPLWGSLYCGPPHIVFGHNAIDGLQLHAWATGLDTGCVYGGRLTAMILEADQTVPKDYVRREKLLVSQPAARVYYDPMRGP